jgi:hypothetical protein
VTSKVLRKYRVIGDFNLAAFSGTLIPTIAEASPETIVPMESPTHLAEVAALPILLAVILLVNQYKNNSKLSDGGKQQLPIIGTGKHWFSWAWATVLSVTKTRLWVFEGYAKVSLFLCSYCATSDDE